MSDDLPTLEDVVMDCNAVVDLQAAVISWGITKNEGWMQRLLALRVACDPWECLSRAWLGPNLNICLAMRVICQLPSYRLIRWAHKREIHDMDREIARLWVCPFPDQVTHNFPGGEITMATAPLLALALSIQEMCSVCPDLDARAALGDEEAFKTLLFAVSLAFRETWRGMERLAEDASWFTQYRRRGHY